MPQDWIIQGEVSQRQLEEEMVKKQKGQHPVAGEREDEAQDCSRAGKEDMVLRTRSSWQSTKELKQPPGPAKEGETPRTRASGLWHARGDKNPPQDHPGKEGNRPLEGETVREGRARQQEGAIVEKSPGSERPEQECKGSRTGSLGADQEGGAVIRPSGSAGHMWQDAPD